MSVIVIGHLSADPANVEALWRDRRADFEAVQAAARAAGAVHHQWGFGDGQVVIIDEWRRGDVPAVLRRSVDDRRPHAGGWRAGAADLRVLRAQGRSRRVL